MALVVCRFEVYLVRLDPAQGHEIKKTRPCLIISPDEMNRHIETVIVAPMTTKGRPYPPVQRREGTGGSHGPTGFTIHIIDGAAGRFSISESTGSGSTGFAFPSASCTIPAWPLIR